MKLLRMLGIALVAVAAVGVASAQSWTPVTALPGSFGAAGAMALLTDGRVLVHDESGNSGTWGNWWTLTPDINGNYATGTWTQVATMPSGYGPLYFGSAVLPDGRYIAEGGEYNNGRDAWTTKGAIYDPSCQQLDFGNSAQRMELHRRFPQRHSDQRNLHAEQLLRHPEASCPVESVDLDLDLNWFRQIRHL